MRPPWCSFLPGWSWWGSPRRRASCLSKHVFLRLSQCVVRDCSRVPTFLAFSLHNFGMVRPSGSWDGLFVAYYLVLAYPAFPVNRAHVHERCLGEYWSGLRWEGKGGGEGRKFDKWEGYSKYFSLVFPSPSSLSIKARMSPNSQLPAPLSFLSAPFSSYSACLPSALSMSLSLYFILLSLQA